MGRRRSWVIPIQLLCGVLMLAVCYNNILFSWLGEVEGSSVNIPVLTAYFLALYFLMATQDIAVDGWALTLLPYDKQHLAGNINAAGQTFGYFLSYVVFLVLNNGEYCDMLRTIKTGKPILTLTDFFLISGVSFILTTIYVWVFIPENPIDIEGESATTEANLTAVAAAADDSTSSTKEEDDLSSTVRERKKTSNPPVSIPTSTPSQSDLMGEPESVWEVFTQFGLLFRNRPVQIFGLILFIQGAAMSVQGSALQLKVVHAGLPTAELAALSPIFIGIGILLPVLMSKFINQGNQLKWLWRSMLFQLFLFPISTILPRLIHADVSANTHVSFPVLSLVILTVIIGTVQSNTGFCALLAFYPSVADPKIGGTYVTLLTTLSNASRSFIRPVCMLVIQWLDDNKPTHIDTIFGKEFDVTGYEVASVFCGVISILWLIFTKKPLFDLQARPVSDWWVRKKDSSPTSDVTAAKKVE